MWGDAEINFSAITNQPVQELSQQVRRTGSGSEKKKEENIEIARLGKSPEPEA